VANNLTIEAPNFDKIQAEAGQFTSDAVNLLWVALNDTRKSQRLGLTQAIDKVEPKVLSLQPTASVDDLDLQGCSIVSFVGSTSVNFTGMRPPDTGKSRVVLVQVSGSGTITAKHNATSQTAAQLTLAPGADFSMTTAKGVIFTYLQSKWREVARSG
jgi:hypothetical protein